MSHGIACRSASEDINDRLREYATVATDTYFRRHPEDLARWGARSIPSTRGDFEFHLRHLAEALRSERPELFNDYLAWARVFLPKHNIPVEVLQETIDCMRVALADHLPAAAFGLANQYLDAGLQTLPQAPEELPSFVDLAEPRGPMLQSFLNALLSGDRQLASRTILDAVNSGVDIRDVYLNVFAKSQYEVGRLWQLNRITVAQEHYCTAATQFIMSQLYPKIFSAPRSGKRMVAACVGGDLHELGLRMISDLFELEGWDTYFLGADTPSDGVVEMVVEKNASLLAISATMTFHLATVSDLIRQVRADPAASSTRILVGGAPFNRVPGLWAGLGADGFARDAQEAIQVAAELTRETS